MTLCERRRSHAHFTADVSRNSMEGTLFGIAAILLGVLSLGYALYTYRRGIESQSWPKAEGTIIHVSVKHAGSTGDVSKNESQREWYLPVIEYTYSVRGRTYKGNRILIGELSSMPHESALELLQPYREGAKVRVSYDPANPANAVLQTRVNTGAVARYAVIGIVLLLVVAYAKFFWGRVNW